MKNLIGVMVLSLLVAPLAAEAFPPDKSGNCLDCHKLDRKEAEEIVKRLAPNARVTDIKLAPVKAFWQIEAEQDGKRGIVLLDFTKQFLGQLSPVPRKAEFSKLPFKDAMVLGSRTAKKRVAIFTDPDCPACRQLHETMKQVLQKRKDIAFYLFFYPLAQHPDAPRKSRAILCERSEELLDNAYAGKMVPDPACATDLVEKNLKLGQELGISSTPSLIREDGLIRPGAPPVDMLINWIDGK